MDSLDSFTTTEPLRLAGSGAFSKLETRIGVTDEWACFGGGGISQQVTASFSKQSGVSSEREVEGQSGWLTGLLHSEQWIEQERLSEEIDKESEWLYLNLKPEEHVDKREEAEWQRQALLARQRFESSLAEGRAMRVSLSTFIDEA
jgi:hypothetical protein